MGGEAEVTVMVLKVDLGCVKCCRKVKRVLCSIPQVRNQIFDDKTNTVTVSVLCCTPERVIRKISEKAGRTVKGIDILQPSASAQPPPKPVVPKEAAGPPLQPSVDKPKPQAAPPAQVADKPKSAPAPAEKPKSDDKPKPAVAPPPADKPKSDDKPKPAAAPPTTDKPKSDEKAKSALPPMDKPKSDDKPKPAAAAPPPTDDKPKKPENSPPPPSQQQQQIPVTMKPNQPAAFMSPELFPVAGYPSIFPPPHVVYYDQGGPYNTYQNQIQQPLLYPPYGQPIYQYDGYQGRPVVGDGYYGGGKQHFAEDNNPSACSVM